MVNGRSRWLHVYVTAVTCAGAAVALGGVGAGHARSVTSPVFWVFVAIVVVLESFSIRLPAGHDDTEVTTSTTFGYALLLMQGAGPAAVAFAAGAVANGLTHRKPWFKVAFNAGQFSVAALLSGAVLAGTAPGYSVMAAPMEFLPEHLPGAALGAAVFILANFALLAVVVALAADVPVRAYARSNLGSAAGPTAVMLSVSPMVAVVGQASLWYLVLLAVPIVALFKVAEISIGKEHQALHDPLTDLPNRRLFVDRVAQALLARRRQGRSVAVLVLDLDRFKQVNDTLGRAAGDELLRTVAERLSATVGRADTVARLGADEFGVVLRDTDGEHTQRLTAEIRRRLLAVATVAGVPLEAPASIGVALSVGDETADEVMRRADTALDQAKAGRLGVAWYDPEFDPEASQDTRTRLALSNELRAAIGDHQIVVVYQPQVCVTDRRVVAVEALARWRHPQRGVIGAGSLIPLAEDTGLIRELSVAVMRQALTEVGRWQRQHGVALRVSVNMVADNLLEAGFVDTVEQALAASGLPAQRLCLEVTESDFTAHAADSPAALADALATLRDRGVQLSIDDFGTGMSSLARLRDLPVDELKIDRTFVDDLNDPRSHAFVRAIVTLGRDLGLRIVGEGVEDDHVLGTLQALEVDVAQGFLFTVPLWGADYLAWHGGWTDGRVLSRG